MQQQCPLCNSPFNVSDWERNFLKQISPAFGGTTYDIPAPEHCPQCRLMHRYLWRAELHLFKRKSDLSGETILSFFPEGSPYTVYSPEEWWSDDWNPLDYGRAFDFTRPFFEQFFELLSEVPLISRIVVSNENCDFVNNAGWNRNCYLLAGGNHNEDCYYGNFVNHCTNCIDNSFIEKCELCYGCIDCSQCYNCHYSQNCSNCSDSHFLFNCRGCKNCFGSVNLVEKEFVWMNQQLSKEEYEQKLAAAELHKRSRVQQAQAFFEGHRLQYPHKHLIGEMNENVTGNAVLRSRNCFDCFDVSDCEDCRYCGWLHQSKNCADCYAFGLPAEECYQCMEVGGGSSRVLFSVAALTSVNVLYSYITFSSNNLFGCVSMRHNEFCILNKQYEKEEYEALVPNIIKHMQETGEWGRAFPAHIAPLAYNQTIANDYMPKTREEAEELGARWNTEEEKDTITHNEPIPDSVHDIDESICDKVLPCSKTGKAHRIIQKEFAFLKEHSIPVPDMCWTARHNARLAKRNPRQLWDRTCGKCGAAICSSYAPERPEIVYCESCYLAEVY